MKGKYVWIMERMMWTEHNHTYSPYLIEVFDSEDKATTEADQIINEFEGTSIVKDQYKQDALCIDYDSLMGYSTTQSHRITIKRFKIN